MGNITAASFPTSAIDRGAMGFLPRRLDGFAALQAFPVRVTNGVTTGQFITFTQGDQQRINSPAFRSPLGQAERIELGSAKSTFNCTQRALRTYVSDVEVRNATATGLYDPRAVHTKNVMAAVLRAVEEEWSVAYFKTGFWDTDQAAPSTKWDSADGGDPIGDVGTAVDSLSDQLDEAVGEHAVLVIGYKVWNTLQRHVAFKDFAGVVNVQGTSLATREKIAQAMGVRQIIVSHAVKNTALDDVTAVQAEIVGDGALLLMHGDPFSVEEPTAGCTFLSQPLRPRVIVEPSNPQGAYWVEAAMEFDFTTPWTGGGVFLQDVMT